MAVFSLFRGTAAQVAAREKHEGQMLLATDTAKLSFDLSSSNRITISGDILGPVAIADGGTGQTTAVAARNALSATRTVYSSTDPYTTCNNGDIWIA